MFGLSIGVWQSKNNDALLNFGKIFEVSVYLAWEGENFFKKIGYAKMGNEVFLGAKARKGEHRVEFAGFPSYPTRFTIVRKKDWLFR